MTLYPPKDQDLILVGGSGNLARKKLLPALYNLSLDGLLPKRGTFAVISHDDLDDNSFRKLAESSIKQFSRRSFDKKRWDSISSRFRFVNAKGGAAGLREIVDLPERTAYLAIPPSAIGPVTQEFQKASLVEGTKLVVEKPFGIDIESSRALDATLRQIFDEEDIFRIDHYLGKETVQNILALRFGNSIFERIWNRDSIEHVQITISEDIGVEERGPFYEEVGALRDIVQNHALQVISLLAMEPPISFAPERIRDERVKLLRVIAPLYPHEVVRGQYTAGEVNGESVPGYRDELGVGEDSSTDTFIAAKFHVDNWRWAGVPFYVRAGKRLPRRITEVQIAFSAVPMTCFQSVGIQELPGNHLTIRIQPSESISVSFAAKTPGPDMQVEPVRMNFRYDSTFAAEPQEAYERLLYDAMVGDQTLFLRSDAVDRAWEIVQPIVDDMPPIMQYPAGTWGPEQANDLLDSRAWHIH